MKLKKILTLALAAVLAGTALASCAAKGFDKDGAITVISREKGSGTRSAFIELFGVEVDKEDKTVETADITDKTNVMMTSVSQNANAIGYISLGSLNDSVKALKIDGAAATVENIENGSYKISRPFNIATKSEPSEAAADFIAFILSDEGQKVVKDNGYIPVKTNGAYNGSKPSGKISIGGSSSVTPVMEKLKEAYNAVNPNVTIELGAHTDRKGSEQYNERLAQRRAQSVVDYLIAGGIAQDRLEAKGYGESVPKTINKKMAKNYDFLNEGDVLTEEFIDKLTPEQQEIADQINRRTEFKVLRTNYNLF